MITNLIWELLKTFFEKNIKLMFLVALTLMFFSLGINCSQYIKKNRLKDLLQKTTSVLKMERLQKHDLQLRVEQLQNELKILKLKRQGDVHTQEIKKLRQKREDLVKERQEISKKQETLKLRIKNMGVHELDKEILKELE